MPLNQYEKDKQLNRKIGEFKKFIPASQEKIHKKGILNS